MILTAQELAAYLRIDDPTPDELSQLEAFIRQAQGVCEDFCRKSFDTSPPEAVRLAALLLASHYYTYREAGDPSAENAIRFAAENLLWPHRDESKLF